MDINRLNEFITLATLLNYSKAANQLYLTQPALSRHIHDLEQTLGTQLFIQGYTQRASHIRRRNLSQRSSGNHPALQSCP